jgi:hypothetical protein
MHEYRLDGCLLSNTQHVFLTHVSGVGKQKRRERKLLTCVSIGSASNLKIIAIV